MTEMHTHKDCTFDLTGDSVSQMNAHTVYYNICQVWMERVEQFTLQRSNWVCETSKCHLNRIVKKRLILYRNLLLGVSLIKLTWGGGGQNWTEAYFGASLAHYGQDMWEVIHFSNLYCSHFQHSSNPSTHLSSQKSFLAPVSLRPGHKPTFIWLGVFWKPAEGQHPVLMNLQHRAVWSWLFLFTGITFTFNNIRDCSSECRTENKEKQIGSF